jgi:1-acyl-sn-glycerol-3-phosphate acyltransferase
MSLSADPSRQHRTAYEWSDEARARQRPLRWMWDTFSFFLVLGVLAIGFSAWSLFAALLTPILPRQVGRRLGQSAINVWFSLFLFMMRVLGIARCDLTALDAVRDARGVVFAANHVALLDILLLGSRLPRTVCIMKASLYRNPLLSGGRLAGYICNDDAVRLVRRAASALREGSNLLIFPEGTRYPAGQLGPFRRSFALIAKQARAPVRAIFIETNSPYLRKSWPLWRRPTFPLEYRVRVGPPQFVDGDAEAFCEEFRAHFLAKAQSPIFGP